MTSSLLLARRFLATAAVVLSCVAPAVAQTQVSTMGSPQTVSLNANLATSITQDSWIGFSFTTGSQVGGYSLNSITTQLSTLTGGANPFGLLTLGSGGLPTGGVLASFTTATVIGNNPTFTPTVFTPTASFTLLPNTQYVFTVAPGDGNTGSWDWGGHGTAPVANAGWSMTTGASFVDPDRDGGGPDTGSGPNQVPGSNVAYLMASVDATPVPEPATNALIAGLVAIGATVIVRRRKAAAANAS